MKRRITFLMTAFLLMFSYVGLAQVVSGTTYSTPSVSDLPEGWSGEDGGGTNYIKLIDAAYYIQTAEFEQIGFTSVTIKARKFGGPSATQAQISVSWYDSEGIETVLGTIDPTNTTLTDYTINSPATTENGTGYIKIQNKGASSSKGSGVSEVTITYTEPGGTTPTTYTVTYNANVAGVAPVVDTYAEGADVTLRDANTFTNEGYTFSEWNTQADGDGDPYDAGGTFENIQANLVLYAIWIEDIPSDEQWVLTNLADLTANDVFVIVGNNGSNYAMANNDGTTNPPTAVAVTVTNNEITGNVAQNIQWNISGNATEGYVFYPNGNAESWLYCTNANNGVRVGTNEDNTFMMETSSGYLVHQGTSRYVGIYNSQNWRCYTSINNNIAGQTFAFYKKVTGGIIPPSISADNVEIAYNATAGSITYTINNGVEGGTMSASVTEGDWLTLGQGTVSPIQFTCSANEAGTERTATVTLTYTYDRATVTKDVTITQGGNPNVTMTIAEVRAQGTGSVVTTGIVTSCVGITGYIQDNTAAICVYGAELTVGDEIRVSGALSTYHGLMEIGSNNNTPTVTMLSSGNTVEPIIKTIAEINADDYTANNSIQGLYVTIENATVTAISGQNTTIAQGENTIVVRGISGVEYAVNDVITLDGNIGCYDAAQIANPQNVQVQVSPAVPSITVNPSSIDAPAEGTEGTLAITYENIPDLISFDYYFCDANGDELEDTDPNYPDWINAEINEEDDVYSISYTINPNDGAARTAYMKVYTTDVPGNEEVYTIVAINQEEYVAPTFAALPFEFDGGKAAIDTIDGLYQEGLGGDYNNSPKLKFDGTGDYLLLQFNEVPGALTFDIKGNGFSGGTFTVQTSEDGVTYTDLEVYDNLTTTVQSESFNLSENVRYIKWIYTEKVNGNVALGNIVLYEEGGGPAPETYDLTIEPFENLEIFAFVGGDETQVALEGAGTIQVAEGDNVMLSITANEGYEISSLMVDGVEHVNDIDEAAMYAFVMPDHNVTVSATAVAVVPFEPATYTLATSIESGKTYIIVGSKTIDEETTYYAMSEQKNNNRRGVAISVDGTTATVETEDVYEFVITALEENGFYSIYDDRTPGYLYAAATGSNHLKTEPELDTLHNGDWAISIDDETGLFSIVASNSSNRNVMQFNYNNGSPIFSCYGLASQSPVYLYVKDETPSVATQTIELAEGWNWVSLYIDASDDPIAMLQALEAALGDNAEQISASDIYTEYMDGEWWGDLDDIGITNDQTYMIYVTTPCTIQIQGHLANVEDYTIEINPGWNWIGFPSTMALDINEALAAFEAEEEDMIQTSVEYVEFYGEWFGDFETLEPGQGYMYFSNSEETKYLTFQVGSKLRRR